MRIRQTAAVVAIAALALALGACGGSREAKSPQAVLLGAPAKTTDAGTARMSMNMEMTGLGSSVPGGTYSLPADGVVDLATGESETTIEMGGLGSVRMRIVDGTIYYDFGAIAGSSQRPWVKVDLAELGFDPAMFSQGQSDPTQVLAYLAAASDDVREVGKEEVRGDPTTHYRAKINIAKALERPGLLPTLKRQLEQLLSQPGQEGLEIDVWIDAKGRARRIAYGLGLDNALPEKSRGEVPAGARMEIKMEMYDFGVPVDVAAPAADEISDLSLSDLMAGAGAGVRG